MTEIMSGAHPYSPKDLLDQITRVMRDAYLDENAGDWTERAETVLWFATGGAEGKDWGIRGDDAENAEGS